MKRNTHIASPLKPGICIRAQLEIPVKSILLGFLLVALGSVTEPQDTVTLDSAAAVTGTAPGDTAGQPSRASSNLGYSVDGVVTYATGRPAKAAFISLVSPDLNVHSRQAVSDEFGRFRFDGIQGNYLVRVDIPNAASTLRRLYADRNLNISIILDERPVKPEWSWTQTILTVVVLVLFLFTIEVTRWHHIATSIVSMILGHVDTLKARLATEAAGADPAMTKPLNDLLDRVKTEMTRKLRAYSPDLLFWSRGRENANWVLLHEVERQLASFLAPPEQVEAYLRFIGPELRSLNTAPAIAIADAIALEIQAASPDQVTRKALLGRGIAIVNANRDNTFSTLMEWQNKVSWLIVIAVGMIGFLSVGVGNSILFLAGGAGGYLSRLMRAIRRDDIPLDYGASWTTLFLSPLFGALAAWFGIALITVLARPDLQLLGEAFRLVRWDDPRGPA